MYGEARQRRQDAGISRRVTRQTIELFEFLNDERNNNTVPTVALYNCTV
jgi:hypothetical protein